MSSAILLVEDEPVLRSSMARGLSKLTNVEVMSAANMAEAITLLGTRTPSLVISDIDLPGATGIELVGELARRKIEIPIIFVTAYLKTYRAQIPEHPNVLVLEKPIPLEELRARAVRLLGPAGEAARGPFSVVDYAQLACLGRHSVEITVELVNGAAQVVIHQGELWSAADPEGTGSEAFKRLAFLKEGTVTCSSLVGSPGPRTIETRWEQLVLESACELDESKHAASLEEAPSWSRLPALAATPPPASPLDLLAPATKASRPQPPPETRPGTMAPGRGLSEARRPPPLPPRSQAPKGQGRMPIAPASRTDVQLTAKAATFDELWSRAVDALLRHEYEAAAQGFLAASKLRPDDLRVQANLMRLKEMGYIKETGDRP